jgi:hypothetical protein
MSQSHPREHNSDISNDFDQIIGRATALDTEHRYRNVEEMTADLSEIHTNS